MSIPRFETKIIGGKIRKIPIPDNPSSRLGSSQRYPWTSHEGTPKIGSRYSVVPPISDAPNERITADQLLSQRVSDALSSVSRQKLENVHGTFVRLDYDKSGRITTKELNDVFLLYNIFILGPTMMALVKKFESQGGGVWHELLWKFLEECHSALVQDKSTKLNGFASHQPTLTTSLSQQAGLATSDNKLQEEVEKQLAQANERDVHVDTKELRASFQSCDRGGTGSIGFREMKLLCQHHRVPISQSLLERTLNKFDSSRDGWINWREFLELLERVASKVSKKNIHSVANSTSNGLKRNSSNVRSSIQTQTSTAPDPVSVYIRGRKVYVYPPDEFVDVDISADQPDEKLALEWVYGYRGRDCRNNLFILQSGEVIYFIAAVVVIYNKREQRQRHYTEHTDDIKSLAIHPDGVTVATGQVAGHEKVQGEPHIRIWDSGTLQTKTVIGLGYFERAVVSLDFSIKSGVDQGRFIVSVDDNDYHTITVWDWASNKKIANARGHMDQVLAICFSPFDNTLLVSCGKQHMSFWTIDDDNRLNCDRGRFDNNVKPKYISCVAFAKNGDVISGDTNGTLFVWEEGSNQISASVKNAHDGPVYSLLVLQNGVLLSAGGRDGVVRAWDRRLQPMGVQLKFPRSVTGIRTLAVDQLNTLYAGTVNNGIWSTELAIGISPLMDVGTRLKVLVEGHADDLRGLATHPVSSTFVTAGGDKTVKLWNADQHRVLWSARLPAPAQAATFHRTEDMIALGHKDGSFAIVQASSGNLICHKRCAREKISEIKISPDGTHLAVASHDNNIYIYKVQNGGQSVELCGKCSGHSSYVTHIDWSADSEKMQSTSGDYELLFWDAKKCEHITSSADMRNTHWATQNCILGFPVVGIWPTGADGTDVNSVDRSHSRELLATGDDFGDVNLFHYPCANKKAKPRIAKGHSAHVTCVRFLHDDSRLISVGGRDASIMQWKIV